MGVLAAAAIGAGISAIATVASSAVAQGQANGRAAAAGTAAEKTAAAAQQSATNANSSQQTQATGQAQGVQADFAKQAAASNGLGNQSNVFGQLQNVASGQGPNPAQAMLAQQTGANTQNQAALMAGQRGAGANVGLMGRQAAMQGGANQQNAAGQGATLQAQQSLGALNQMGGIAGQQVGQQMGANQQSAATALGNQDITSRTTMQGAGMGAGAANAASQQAQDAGAAADKTTNTAIGGLASGLGTAAQSFLAPSTPAGNSGPMTTEMSAPSMPNEASGGYIEQNPTGPRSYVTHLLMGKGTPQPKMAQGGMAHASMAIGGQVPAMVSPGERYLPPQDAKTVAQGKKDALVAGMRIKGKAKVKGDSLQNDTVPKTLEEGGVVIPKSILEGPNPHQAAYKFVNAVMAKSKAGK